MKDFLLIDKLSDTDKLPPLMAGEFVVYFKDTNRSLYLGESNDLKRHFSHYLAVLDSKAKKHLGLLIMPSDAFTPAEQISLLQQRAGAPTRLDKLYAIKNGILGRLSSILRGYKGRKTI